MVVSEVFRMLRNLKTFLSLLSSCIDTFFAVAARTIRRLFWLFATRAFRLCATVRNISGWNVVLHIMANCDEGYHTKLQCVLDTVYSSHDLVAISRSNIQSFSF
jgi:hypothetical protein